MRLYSRGSSSEQVIGKEVCVGFSKTRPHLAVSTVTIHALVTTQIPRAMQSKPRKLPLPANAAFHARRPSDQNAPLVVEPNPSMQMVRRPLEATTELNLREQ